MRGSRVAAATLVALAAACVVGTGIIAGEGRLADSFDAVTLLVPAFFFCVIGAVIVYRRPGNRMGWIFAVVGFLSSTGSLADEYANYAVESTVAGRPQAVLLLASWYSEWFWIPFIFLMFCFSVLLFPSGSLPSPRWRPFAATLITIMASLMIGAVSALASLIARFRRCRGEERQQLKWFTYSAALMVVTFIFGGVVLDALFQMRAPLLETMTMAVLPVGASIAILKYRLYDIDLDALGTGLLGVVSDTVRPRHASPWLAREAR